MLADKISWSDFLDKRFYWEQGEHVSLIGPTGGGKTTLGLSLLHRRKLVCIIATKPRDDTVTGFMSKNRDYRKISHWGQRHELDKRVVLWPPYTDSEPKAIMAKQRSTVNEALGSMFRTGKWCVFADEVRYLTNNLALKEWADLYWLQGRSIKLSIVAATQRPAWVPLEMYSQATHLFFWKDNDERNLKRIAGLGSMNPRDVAKEVRSLDRHEVLYINTRSDDMLRTRMEF